MKTNQLKETMNQYKIGIVKFKNHISHNTDEARSSFITVKCKDEIDAIIEHNKIFRNYYNVQEYLIIPLNGKPRYSIATDKQIN
jgi:hypothetical protein